MFFVLAGLWLASAGFVVVYFSTLSTIIRRMRVAQIEVRPGSPDELEGLDLARLEEATRELETLGFEQIGDLVSRHFLGTESSVAPIADPTSAPAFVPPPKSDRFKAEGFSRVFTHRTESCQGILNSVVSVDSKGQRRPVVTFSVAISAASGRGEDRWSYSTTSYMPTPILKKLIGLTRRPRVLWTRMPEAKPPQLLSHHLMRRGQIAQAAQITWQSDFSLADQIAAEKKETQRLRAFFGQMTPSKMWRGFAKTQRDHKSLEWLGELRGRL